MAKKFNPHKYTYHFNIGHNIKLGEGVASWSTLKGSELLYIPRLEKRVRGTCKDCDYCTKDCYVNKSYRRYPKTAMYGHAVNTIGLRTCPSKVFQDLNRQLSVTKRSLSVSTPASRIVGGVRSTAQDGEKSPSPLCRNLPGLLFCLPVSSSDCSRML